MLTPSSLSLNYKVFCHFDSNVASFLNLSGFFVAFEMNFHRVFDLKLCCTFLLSLPLFVSLFLLLGLFNCFWVHVILQHFHSFAIIKPNNLIPRCWAFLDPCCFCPILVFRNTSFILILLLKWATLVWLVAGCLSFVPRHIDLITVRIRLALLGFRGTWKAVVVLVVVVRGHFLLGWTLAFTFHVVLDVLVLYLTLGLDEERLQEVFHKKWLSVGVACHLAPKLVEILLCREVDGRYVCMKP